jgi:hypothetical protein
MAHITILEKRHAVTTVRKAHALLFWYVLKPKTKLRYVVRTLPFSPLLCASRGRWGECAGLHFFPKHAGRRVVGGERSKNLMGGNGEIGRERRGNEWGREKATRREKNRDRER